MEAKTCALWAARYHWPVTATSLVFLIAVFFVTSVVSFVGKGIIRRRRLMASILLTVGGSALGALFLLNIPVNALRITIAIVMIPVAVFSLLNKNVGMTPRGGPPCRLAEFSGFGANFLLAV